MRLTNMRGLQSLTNGKIYFYKKVRDVNFLFRWKTWSKSYDDDLYEDTDESEHVTRYPLPNLNENGHIDMSEFGFRDTLDEYFDIFVIILRYGKTNFICGRN